jgi:GlpG protein
MRELATLPSSDSAQALADYLLTLRIDTKVERQPEGWAVWVRDEDQMARARQELDEFTRNPNDPRYTAAAREADALRREKASADKAYHRRQNRFNRRMSDAGATGRWTIALIAACALVSLVSKGATTSTDEVVQALSISPYKFVPVYSSSTASASRYDEEPIGWELYSPGLEPILHGQVWRLVTPMFIHFRIWHLVFDMYCLYLFGGAIERQRGPLRYLSLVLFLAVLSNLCQYFLGHATWDGFVPHLVPNPAFGGMSGVGYGLFGYIWMKARFQPELGLDISPGTVTFLMIWFFLCMTPWIHFFMGSNVANVAHASGLLGGMFLGYTPILWRSFRSE